jgi:hypothetical protein
MLLLPLERLNQRPECHHLTPFYRSGIYFSTCWNQQKISDSLFGLRLRGDFLLDSQKGRRCWTKSGIWCGAQDTHCGPSIGAPASPLLSSACHLADESPGKFIPCLLSNETTAETSWVPAIPGVLGKKRPISCVGWAFPGPLSMAVAEQKCALHVEVIHRMRAWEVCLGGGCLRASFCVIGCPLHQHLTHRRGQERTPAAKPWGMMS